MQDHKHPDKGQFVGTVIHISILQYSVSKSLILVMIYFEHSQQLLNWKWSKLYLKLNLDTVNRVCNMKSLKCPTNDHSGLNHPIHVHVNICRHSVHCKNCGVLCTPKRLHTTGVLTHQGALGVLCISITWCAITRQQQKCLYCLLHCTPICVCREKHKLGLPELILATFQPLTALQAVYFVSWAI